MLKKLKAFIILPLLWWRTPGTIYREPALQPEYVRPAGPALTQPTVPEPIYEQQVVGKVRIKPGQKITVNIHV